MSERDDGGPAFPITPEWDEQRGSWVSEPHPGMSLRDYFAAKALANMYTQCDTSPDKVAEWAYHVADAMLVARALAAKEPQP